MTAVDDARISTDADTAVVEVHYGIPVTEFDGSAGVDALWTAARPTQQKGLTVALGGQVPENFTPPSGTAELAGVLAALIILVFAFGTVLAGLGSVSTTAPTVASMVGIGVGIDYALLLVTRFAEGLRSGLSVRAAAARSNGTARVWVIFAGTTVLLSLIALRLADLPVYTSVGLPPCSSSPPSC